jgi:hypothetical protein
VPRLNHRNWAIYARTATPLRSLAPARLLYPTSSSRLIDPPSGHRLGDLAVEAYSGDRMVEAIRHTGPGYVFAVHNQFHAPTIPRFRRHADPRRFSRRRRGSTDAAFAV